VAGVVYLPPTMNIFVLSLCARCAAEMHCDKHVVKMILETAQLLYSAHHLVGTQNLPEGAYKMTHKNHPCSIWVRESVANYKWLAELGWWLCKEYQFRYGELRTHKTEHHIVWLKEHVPVLPNTPMTPIRQAMPDQFKCDNPVAAYQTYYRESKFNEKGIVKYTRRAWPDFLVAERNAFT